MSKTLKELFVTCSQDLEPLLVQELQEMGFPLAEKRFRGVVVPDSSLESIYKINYCSRLASRVLFPLTRFPCRHRADLYNGASNIDWTQLIKKGQTFAIDANVNHRDLTNSLFAAQVVKDAICDQFRDRFGIRPSVDVKNPDVQLNLFIAQETANISFDTSGSPLFKRGYRQETLEAPLRESLAAAILRLANYKGTEVLYDPCCGSGTILIEAALIATHTPPGYIRQRWGFMSLPHFDQALWLKVKVAEDSKRIALPKGKLFGTDLNKNAIHVTKVNLRASGFTTSVEASQYDFRDYVPPVACNLMVTNPPHGNRLDEAPFLKPLYRALGDFMKQKMAKPARAFVFVGDLELSKEVGLAPTKRHVLDNAGIDSRLLEFDIF